MGLLRLDDGILNARAEAAGWRREVAYPELNGEGLSQLKSRQAE